VCGTAVPDDPPCFQPDTEEDVEGNKTEGGDGEEAAGKEGVPVSTEELFPGEVWFQIAGFTGAVQDFGDGFMGYVKGQLFQFVPDAAQAPEVVFFFKRYNQVFKYGGEGRPAGSVFPVYEVPGCGEGVLPGFQDSNGGDEGKGKREKKREGFLVWRIHGRTVFRRAGRSGGGRAAAGYGGG
jgi:hypothetical protein